VRFIVTTTDADLDRIAERFRSFGRLECPGRSALYAQLSEGIAGDAALLRLAAHARPGTPLPNVLFAAVHFLLLGGVQHPLAAFYADLDASPSTTDGDPFPALRDFCHEHHEALLPLVATRLVQTAQVRRCSLLLPAFELVFRRGNGRPLALVEIGASAGLNLRWDRYRYAYSDGRRCGPAGAPLELGTTLRGGGRPPLPESRLPPVATRLGLDLNPIDVRDPEETRWLRALIWPDETGKAQELERALAAALAEPPPLVAGDALDTLPAALAAAPAEAMLCVYHSFTVNQFSPTARERLRALFVEQARRRDLFVISLEGTRDGVHPRLDLATFRDGVRGDELLATCDAHGAWLEWRE
jgi:hypothetical protein